MLLLQPLPSPMWTREDYYLFALNLNRTAVVIGGTGKDHEVATWGLVLAAHHLANRSDCIDDGGARRVGHEALQGF
jgi:hypothetical protein